MADHTAASASQADVQAKIDLAVDGDRVLIPTGTASWANTSLAAGITITKGIELIGNGITNTVISNGNTVVSKGLVQITLKSGFLTRMSGIGFVNAGNLLNNNNGLIRITGSNTNGSRLRIDNCKFDHLKGDVVVPDNCLGVVDHNTWLYEGGDQPIYFKNTAWNGGIFGDASIFDDAYWGTDKFLFVEDNIFTCDNSGAMAGCTDGAYGSRMVFRYNTCTRCDIQSHGTESGGRKRGNRAWDIYRNTWNGLANSSQVIANIRSGIVMFHHNTVTGFSVPKIFLHCHRMFHNFTPYGPADGTNVWDVNQGGGPFATGTASAVGTLTVTVTGTPYTTDQWAGYSIKKTSGVSTGEQFAHIISNTNNTITFSSTGGYDTNLTFAIGETFAIWRVDQALDMPGRAKGSLITGGANDPVLPPGWNDQVTEPCYEWENWYDIGGGIYSGDIQFFPEQFAMVENEHFFNNTVKPGYTEYTYPHPLQGLASGKIIRLAGDMDFGNVLVGETLDSTLTVYDDGDATLNVTSIAYTSAFSGSTSGFVVAPGSSHDVTVTFAPLAATPYTGTITVASDKTSGTNTAACTGTGVSSGGGGGHGKGHKKGVLVARGR